MWRERWMGGQSFKNLSQAIVESGKWETSGLDGWLEIQRRVDVASRGRNPALGTSVFSLRTAAVLVASLGRTLWSIGSWTLSTCACSCRLRVSEQGGVPVLLKCQRWHRWGLTWYHWHCYLLSHSLFNNMSLHGCLTVTSDPVSAEMWVLPALSIS